MSLRHVLPALQAALGRIRCALPRTASARPPRRPSQRCKPGDVLLLENTRFQPGEEKNDAPWPPAWRRWAMSM
jgi:phosphoglycerate kinase